MLIATQGSEESGVKSTSRDGSDSPMIIDSLSPDVTPGSTGRGTDGVLLGISDHENGDIFSDASSTPTITAESFSNHEDPLVPDLPTGQDEGIQASLAKELVVRKETEEGKTAKEVPSKEENSFKIVPQLAKESTESAKVLKLEANPEISTTPTMTDETQVSLHGDKFLHDLTHVTMLSKKNFKDSGHLKIGRYYLPELPLLRDKGNKSGLLRELASRASTEPCAASYQHCYSETTMIRCQSKGIDDLSSLRIQYWDNSALFI